MKVVLVASNSVYMAELERSFTLDGHIVVAKFISSEDIIKNVQSLDYDYVIISQDLLNNEPINQSIEAMKNINALNKTIAILKQQGVFENYLASNGVQYFYENMAPSVLVQNIAQKYNFEVQYAQHQQTNLNQNNQQSQQQPIPNIFPNENLGYQPYQPPQPPHQFPLNQQIPNQNIQNGNGYINTNRSENVNLRENSFSQQNQGYNSIPNYSEIPTQHVQQEPEKDKIPKAPLFNGGRNVVNFKNTFVVVNSPKGGVGKTSLAIELATTIADRAKDMDLNPASKLDYAKEIKICLLDLNPSFDTMASTLTCVRNVPNYPTVLNWVDKIEQKIYAAMSDDDRLLYDENKDDFDLSPYCNTKTIRFTWAEIQTLTVRDNATGLYIIPAVPLPTDVEKVLPDYISIIIETVKEYFDVTITDTSNNLTYFTVEALLQADEVLLVSVPTISTSTVLKRVLDTCQKQLQIDIGKFGLVVNYPNRADSELDGDAVSSALNIPLIATIPYEQAMGASLEKGTPYSVNNPKNKYSQSVTKLAHQIIPLWNVGKRRPTKNRPAKKGFFSRR